MNPRETQVPPAPGSEAGRHREVPSGLADILPEAASRLFVLRRELLSTLERWGYRPVIPPLLEYAEVFSRAAAEPAEDVALYRLVDRASGHVLAMRSDFTPQVSRLVASRFAAASLPLRLCYEGSVVRDVPAQKGRARELHQVGAEFVGVDDPEADAEAIALAVDCLRQSGLAEFKIDVGQVEFFRGVLQDVALDKPQMDKLTSAVARKDGSELATLLQGLPISDRKKSLLAELPLLAGGVEVLERAFTLVESDHSRAALDNLSQVIRYAEAHDITGHLTIDLGEIRGIDYHTGVIFEGFVHHMGVPLCRGGRYDRLLGRYGQELPASGFSLDLVAVLEALQLQTSRRAEPLQGVFIVNFWTDRTPAVGLARDLRRRGVRAARDLMRRPLEHSLQHARSEGFRWAAVLKSDDVEQRKLELLDLSSGGEEHLAITEVATRVAAEEL